MAVTLFGQTQIILYQNDENRYRVKQAKANELRISRYVSSKSHGRSCFMM